MENNMSYLFNSQVNFKGDAIDAFGRLKTSTPFTVFDNQNRYQISDKFDIQGISGGSTGYNLNESSISLIVGTTAGAKTYSETKRVFPYQPGKSLLAIGTFVMNQPKSGLRQRLGYFGCTGSFPNNTPYNGIYLEQSGLTLSMVLESASLGTTTTINQKDWNGDKFDGTGTSGRTLDVTKGNIFWMDIEWLGVGDVRTGFFVDGRPVIAHTFHNDNINPTTYMTTACLPYRYEIENLTGQTGSSTFKQVCTSIVSEAGFEGFSRRYNISTDAVPVTLSSAGTYYPLLSIRLNPNRLDSIIVPSNISAIVTTNTWVHYKVVLNGTFTGGTPTWSTHYNGNVDYVVHTGSLGLTGETDIIGGYINNGGLATVSEANEFNFQLGRTQTGVSDVLTIVFGSNTPNTKVLADLSWFEII
jgi:hypothetical protein